MALDLSDLDTFDFNDRPQAAKNKPKTGLDLFDDLDEFEPRKPYSRRGSVEARNKQAEPDILSKRAQRFQLGNELDAELPAFMGRGEDMLAHPERVKAAAAQVRPDLPAGVDAASYERFMDAESGGMGIVPGTGRSMEDAVVVGQNLGVIGAKFREGWRTTKAGAAADEYLRTGRITVGTTPGVGDVDYPVYLEGDAAEKYVRDLASTTNDTALVEAFDKQVGAGARALTSTLAQPEQLLSIPGGIVGTAVGQPTLGAAVGALPSTIKGYYSELLANLQAGVSPELARANALAGAGVDFATETLGGRFGASGGVLPAAGISAAEEAGAELGRMGSDYAFSFADERFGSKLPKTFGEGVERVTEAGIAGGLGAAAIVGAPRALGAGISAAREMLAKAGGISDGRPDVAQPKASTASVDAPINIAPSNIDTVEAPVTTGINIEGAKRDSVNPDGDSKKREIPAKEDTLPSAPLSAVQLTPADAGTIIDTRLSSLREASQRNRLDEGTVKTLQREDEELRLTLQEDEKRKAAGILQTPERPYLSDNARNLISQKRAEVRERLEQHRAAVGYGNELRDLETRLSKLGESDSDFVALADSLVRGQGASVSRAQQQMAPVAAQNQSQTLPATPVAPTAVEAPVASQGAATSVPATTPTVTSGIAAQAVQSPVTSAQVPQVSNTKPKRTKTPTPKTISEGDALAQAFTELQQKSVSDPAFQKQVTDNPSLMRQMATKRAAEIVAASKAPKAPAAPVTDAADVPTTASAPTSRLASVQNARAAMLVVGNAEVPASSEMRRVANELKASPNVQATKVVTVSAKDAATPGNPLHKQMEDGTNASKPGVYNANDDTIYLRDDVPAEVAVHETTHAATVKAIAAVEQGVVSDPDAKLALDNLKAATTRLGELTEADLPGVAPDILARVKYAAKNVQEAVAILRSSPETAKALRDANITVDVRVDRKTKQPVKMNWFKAVVNSVTDLLFRTKVFKQQHRDAVVRVVEKMLLSDVAIESSKKLEKTDVRAIRMSDVAAGNAASRQVGTGANRPVPKTDDMFVGEQAAGDNRALDEAKRLDEDGRDQQTIRMRTGWFRSPWDNKWRREIDDSGAGFKQDFASLEESKVFGTPKKYRLADVLNHPALFAEYPELADVSFTKRAGFMDIFRSIQGSYDADSNEISLTPYAQDPISTLLHEVQHWIQNKETFATGGNQSSAVAALPQKQKELLAKELIADLEKQYSDTLDTYDSLTKLRDSEEVLQKLAAYADAADAADAKVRAEGRGWFDDNTENNRKRAARKELEDALKGAGITADIHELYAKIASKVEKGVGRYSATFAAVNESIADTEKKAAELTTRLGGLASGSPEVLNKELQKHSRAYEFYQSLAGEIEARAVQERMRYPIEERISKDPYEATLVRDRIRKEDAIVTYDGGRAGQESRNTIKPDTGGVELPQGTIEQRIGERIQSWTAPVISPKGTGSTSAKLMGEKAIGISNEQRLAAEVLAVDLKKQMAKELAKGMKKLPEHARARYAFRVGQALAGDVTILDELPKDIRNTVKVMRRMLDDGMLRIIALGAVPASKIRTLLSGEGKWIHRDFDVFHHDPSEYRKKLQAMARAGEDVISPLLPDIEKDLQLPDADVLQTIADMLGTKGGKESWRKESMEKLRKVTGEPAPKRGATPKTNKAVRDAAEEYLRDMAAKWGIGRNTKMDGKDGIVARLIELSKNGDIRAAASRYANSLLDPKAGYNDDAPYVPSVMGIDDSSLDKRRKKVPEWMQTLWGRFQDPVAMFLTSVDNHANVIAKFTALAEYKARGMANGTVLENKEGMTDYNMFPKGFVLLQKENDPLYYGPLNGMWVKQKDMDYLGVTASQRMAEKMLSQGIGPTFFRPYSLLMQPVKMMQIAADHTSFIINAVSAVFMMSRANPFTTIPRGLKAARYTALGGTRFGKALNDSAFNSDVNAMIRQGLLVNNALAGEARRKLRELIMEPGERFLPTPVKLMNKLRRAGGKVSDSLSRALSFFDEAGKVMMVHARMKDLEAIYPDKSRDEIREIAIEHSMQTMPVASREAPIARMAGNSGVANVYATFYAAMVRNTYNHLKLADEYSKMESPAAKRYAFAEMALLSLKSFGVYALTKSAIAVFGYMYSGSDEDDEDGREKAAKAQQEHYDELRAMHPEYQQGDVLYTRESEPDVFHFLSAQRYDPLPFGALAAASARGDENEKMNLLVSYLFSDSPILEPLSNVIGYGVQTTAGEITEPDSFSLSAKERFMKGAEELLKAGVPGAWKRFEKQYKSDDEATPFEMFANNVGFTHGVLDLRKETGNAAAGYLAVLNSLKRDAGKRVSTEDGVFFDAKADFVGDVTARAEAWRIARRKISAMQKYGKSDEWIEEAIDANPYTSSMSKDEVESLLDGVFRVPDYQEWLDRQYEIDIADPKNARRLDEVEEQYARYGKELQQFEEGLADLLKGMEVEYY